MKFSVSQAEIPEDLTNKTLFDNGVEIVKHVCAHCHKEKEKIHFYCESVSRRKSNGHTRKVCKDCWNEHNGVSPETLARRQLGAMLPWPVAMNQDPSSINKRKSRDTSLGNTLDEFM